MSTNRRMARSLTLLVGSTPSYSMHVECARQIAHVAVLTVQVFLRQKADLLLYRDRLLKQFGARQQSLVGPRFAPELVPQTQHPLDGGKHVAGEMRGIRRGGKLRDSLEGALQVSPAELGQATVVNSSRSDNDPNRGCRRRLSPATLPAPPRPGYKQCGRTQTTRSTTRKPSVFR